MKKIAAQLPDISALVFDGWTLGSHYYLEVLASFSSENKNGYSTVLLAFSVFEDEAEHSAPEHRCYIEYLLGCYKKSWKNMIVLIGDNCSVNTALSDSILLPLVLCASHRYKLAAKYLLNKHEETIDKIQVLMTKLRFGVLVAQLRKLMPYFAGIRTKTCWSSTFYMLQRYVNLRSFIVDLNSSRLDDLRLSASEYRAVVQIMSGIQEISIVTNELQKESCTILHTRNFLW